MLPAQFCLWVPKVTQRGVIATRVAKGLLLHTFALIWVTGICKDSKGVLLTGKRMVIPDSVVGSGGYTTQVGVGGGDCLPDSGGFHY